MHFPSMRPALAAFALLAAAAQAQTVTPPPLPPGSQLVRPEPGMNEPERKRYVRAHHHKAHHGRDYTRDDSVHGPEPVRAGVKATGSAVGAGAPAGGAARAGGGVVQDGRGTGPAREQTSRGASSYFYGSEKK